MIPEFHIESRKLLVELFRLDQLDIKFFESYCKKKHFNHRKLNGFSDYHELFNLQDEKIT